MSLATNADIVSNNLHKPYHIWLFLSNVMGIGADSVPLARSGLIRAAVTMAGREIRP